MVFLTAWVGNADERRFSASRLKDVQDIFFASWREEIDNL
jgi:hypothetical protein